MHVDSKKVYFGHDQIKHKNIEMKQLKGVVNKTF